MDDTILINLVEKYNFLYDRRHTDFKNKSMRANAWSTIGSILNTSAGEAEQRFAVLRNRYTVEKKKMKANRSGDAGGIEKKWPLFDILSFLDTFIIPRRTTGNISTCSAKQDQETPILEMPNSPEWDTFTQITQTEDQQPANTPADSEIDEPPNSPVTTRVTITPPITRRPKQEKTKNNSVHFKCLFGF
ncbi:uncharacterized protein LOC116159310 [Photinus pyralis]|uniref:uncharacterized protein LOC116159310 n=1 Tax=Photinus pyralis TaxID=7054 RepID=UPI0012671B68|nr:uncharacterized protein LOC116159310 [Photinus pyralis]